MPLSSEQKKDLVGQYRAGVVASPHVYLVDYKGISVPQVTELRQQVRQLGGEYRVIKNRLMLRAIGGAALEGLGEQFSGPTAVVYGEDPVALAKVLTDFAGEAKVLEFKAGLVDGRPVAGSEIKAIATLPSREALIAKLLFLLQSPISRFATVLAAIPRQFVVALDQVRQKKEETGAAGD
ncbi:MAG: 50S ribosomal protein L10 [Thermoanaerobaculia bacterium]